VSRYSGQLNMSGLARVGFLLVIFSMSCTSTNSDLPAFSKTYKIVAQRLEIDPINFVRPNRIHYADSILFVEDSDKEMHFRAINLANKQVTFIGKIGDGPAEVKFPTSIQLLPDGKIALFIRNKFLYGEFSQQDFLRDSLAGFRSNRRIDPNHQRLVKVNDTVFVGLGIFPRRYAISNQEFEIIDYQHPYPFEADFKDVSYQTLAMAYQGLLRVSPDGTHLVSAALDAGCVEIFNVQGRTLLPVKFIHLTAPQFVPGEGNMLAALMKKENQAGFLDVNVSPQSVFLLYSGKSLEQTPLANTAASTVLVYSWAGEPKYKITLDRDVTCLAVSTDERFLYAFEHGKEPFLLVYELPD